MFPTLNSTSKNSKTYRLIRTMPLIETLILANGITAKYETASKIEDKSMYDI